MNISDFLHQTALRFPEHFAFYDKHESTTYAELSNKVNNLTNLLKEIGIGKYCGVGVMGNNSSDFVAMAFAVMQSGAVVMPIASQVSNDELLEMLTSAKLHFIIEDGSHPLNLQTMQAVSIDGLPIKWKLWQNSKVTPSNIFSPHVPDAALVRFTSGTTGISKGVILSHKTIDERTAAANQALLLSESDKVMWVLSMAYHFVVSIILYIRYGCSIIINHDFMAAVMLSEINKHGATFLYASPMHIRLLASDNSTTQMPSVKNVISTSTGISKEHCEAFNTRFGIPVSQAYGIIEIGLPIINFLKAKEFPNAIGYALPAYDVEILDDKNNSLPCNQTGHLAIRGPGIFDAYLNPPQLRDEILNDTWFMTGDLAKKSDDGLISVEGRKKSMINVAGNKVFPEEVETALNQHPAVEKCRVSGYLHKLLGESVSAEIVLKTGATISDIEELRLFCKKRLSSYKVPQKIVFVDTLPMTGSGKLKR